MIAAAAVGSDMPHVLVGRTRRGAMANSAIMAARVRRIIFILLVLTAQSAHAREEAPAPWVLETTPLAASSVNGLAVDEGGFLWLSDDRGLLRYDGKERLLVGVQGDLVSSYIYQILALANHEVYAAPGGGVAICEPRSAVTDCLASMRGSAGLLQAVSPQGPRPLMNLVQAPTTLALAQRSLGGIWLGREGGVAWWSGGRLGQANLNAIEGQVTALAESSAGQLLVGTSKGLHEIAVTTHEGRVSLAFVRTLLGEAVHALTIDPEERVWAATSRGLWKIDSTRATLTPGLPSNDVRALVVDAEGAVWAGTWNGPARVTDAGVERLDVSGLQDTRVTALATDPGGGVWVGFRTGGVRRAQRQAVRNFGVADGVPSDAATAVWAASDGSVWAALSHEGVLLWRNGKVIRLAAPAGDARFVTCLAEAPDGSIWAGTHGAGLWRWWKDAWHPVGGAQISPTAHVSMIHFTRTGTVWISAGDDLSLTEMQVATTSQAARLNAPVARPMPPVRCQGKVVGATQDALGQVWFATHRGGLLTWAEQQWKCFVPPPVPGRGFVPLTSVAMSPDGTVWAGLSDAGLLRFRHGSFHSFTEAEGLPCDAVTHVQDDGAGNLWYTCGMGAVRVSRSALDAYSEGRLDRIPTFHVDRSSGLNSEETSRQGTPVAMLDPSGHLWVATQAGLARISNPDTVRPPPLPRLRVWSVSVNGLEVPLAKDGTFVGHGRKADVRVHVAAPVLSPRSSLCFGHQVVPRDPQVITDGSASVLQVSGLPPGEHGIVLFVGMSCGQWAPTKTVLRFRLVPPWYSRSIVWGLLAMAVLPLGWIVHRVRFKIIANRYAALELERKRIARDLHDGLGQGFTALRYHLQAAEAQWAKGASTSASTSDVHHTLKNAQALLGKVEQETRDTVWALRSEDLNVQPLDKALAALAATLPADLKVAAPRVAVHCPSPMPRLLARVEAELHQVAREALTNALKHANAKHINIEVEVDDLEVRLSVVDDGVGFNEAPEAVVAAGHFGILGMRERLRRLNGILTIDASPGQGTTVFAAVPRSTQAIGNPT